MFMSYLCVLICNCATCVVTYTQRSYKYQNAYMYLLQDCHLLKALTTNAAAHLKFALFCCYDRNSQAASRIWPT